MTLFVEVNKLDRVILRLMHGNKDVDILSLMDFGRDKPLCLRED